MPELNSPEQFENLGLSAQKLAESIIEINKLTRQERLKKNRKNLLKHIPGLSELSSDEFDDLCEKYTDSFCPKIESINVQIGAEEKVSIDVVQKQ